MRYNEIAIKTVACPLRIAGNRWVGPINGEIHFSLPLDKKFSINVSEEEYYSNYSYYSWNI